MMWIVSLTAQDRLVLIRVKIERAKKHLSEFEAEIAPLLGAHLYVIGPKYNPETGKSDLHIDPGPLPILPFNVIGTAGDIVQNLRSALDHLAWHLAQVGLIRSGAEITEPHHDVSFPVGASLEIYKSRKGRKVQGMLPDAIRAIDSLEPYKGGRGNDTLWRLHELNNIDKHTNLISVGHDHLFTGDGFDGGFWLKTSNPLFSGVVGRENDQDLEFRVREALVEPQVAKSQALLPTLHQLMEFVDDLVTSFGPLLE